MQKSRVLIIEDDKYILKAMEIKFKDAKFNVKTTRMAEEGLEILKKWTPNLIILDILLPGIDGYAFLRTVKNNPEWKKIPVIIASNLSEDKEVDPGVVEYIVKSDLKLEELVNKASKYVTKADK